MKRILLYGLLFLGGAASAQIISFPDANLKNKLLLSGTSSVARAVNNYNVVITIDANADGEIDQNEAAAVGWLDVSYSNITSLAGLEYFQNLALLECRNNQLTNLASVLPPSLTLLECSYNQLSALDISSLPALTHLICNNNQLSSINVSNPVLEMLKASGNLFTTLNTDNLAGLIDVELRNSQLTYLDFSNSPNLSAVDIGDNVLLESINFHNGSIFESLDGSDFFSNPNLHFICIDEGEEGIVLQHFEDHGVIPPNMNTTCSLGTPDFIVANLKIYPNPSKNIVTIDSDAAISSLQLYDMQGRILENVLVNETSAILDLSVRASGTYVLKITTDKGVKVEKLIRE